MRKALLGHWDPRVQQGWLYNLADAADKHGVDVHHATLIAHPEPPPHDSNSTSRQHVVVSASDSPTDQLLREHAAAEARLRRDGQCLGGAATASQESVDLFETDDAGSVTDGFVEALRARFRARLRSPSEERMRAVRLR